LIFGLVGFGFTLGAAIGPYTTGSIFDITGNYDVALAVCGLTAIIALLMAFLIRPLKQAKRMTTRL
jgi:cyanate permease